MNPAEVIAEARIAAFEERWGDGSASRETFFKEAQRDLDALAGAGMVVVSAEDLRAAIEVLEAVNDPWRYITEEPDLLNRLRAALPERSDP
ncbi:hypothetical protein FXF51_05955 [Nonomuraea sp. PA05]|uniref:hypothetical protein n=1 Tax=Nonomuraea sp. PA05 TaxID=2604466 RepID=UPI0011DA8587|nr:hypothetical protein [Nonomuraea sp. PA05]TYB69704.1 hypothetical protein FXF51_05955 [Nonomuraea sp. PA05]